MRNYTTQHVPGTFITFERRQTLASDWNAIVSAGCRITLRQFAEYDPFKAQDVINENNANKGARMLVTNQMSFLFRRHVVDEKLSPYDTICRMKEEIPGKGGLLVDRRSRR